MNEIELRAHHGLCLKYFVGKGYSCEFTQNMAQIKSDLNANTVVKITTSPDPICRKCPNLANGKCVSADKVRAYDRAVMNLCGINQSSISYGELSDLIRNRIILADKRKEVCGDCAWNDFCQTITPDDT